jgi:hypothetical protein
MTTQNINKKKWQMTLPADWKVKQIGEDGVEAEIALRDHPSLEKYGTKDEAVKALVHAQRMLGKSPDGYIRLPGEDEGAEEFDALYAALGRPEGVDGYELPDMELPEGFVVKDEILGGLKAKAHELGLSAKQVSGLYEWFMPIVMDTHYGLEAEAGQLRDSEMESLRAIHRGETPGMLDRAMRAAEAIGGPELLNALDKTRAGDHAAVISAFAKMAPLVLEGGFRGSSRGWGEELSRDQLREMMKDPRYSDPTQRDEAYVKKIRQGFETLYPGDYIPGSRP